MFGADVAQVSLLENEGQRYETRHQDTLEYLFPKFTQQTPWQQTDQHRNRPLLEDFILIAEFSEQEGPRPVIVIPKDGGQNFDQNEFSVKILAVDHQSSIVEGCEITEDAQVVMSDPDTDTHAFIHHIVLNDIQARGYVRPFCISYVTSDPLKIMKCYEEISLQLRKVARLMKYGNRLVFMRDLEKHQEDLSYTKAHLLLSQNRAQVSSQGDNDLLHALNTLRQCMEEVKDILSNLKPLIQVDTELSERFHYYERELKSKGCHGDIDSDSSSLKDFGSKSDAHPTSQLSGSYTDRTTPEFSLFSKVKDQKPKILDVSTIRGKRRFDRSLRGLHELCSWGAKEGLQRLRSFREFLKRDLTSIYVDELDMAALVPEKGALCFSNSTVGANFLSTSGSIKNSCCVKRKVSEVTFHHAGLTSLGSVESFKSLSSSFQSFYDDDAMYSANSSMKEASSSGFLLDRQVSEISGATGQEGSDHDDLDLQFPHDNSLDTDNYLESSAVDLKDSLLDTLKADNIKFDLESHAKYNKKTEEQSKTESFAERGYLEDNTKDRSNSADSEFVDIDIERDLKCNARGCVCDKEKKLADSDKCNTNVTGATVEDQKELVQTGAECNVCNKEMNSYDKEVIGNDGIHGKMEEICENTGEIMPLMTDRMSTLCEQSSVIIEHDRHLKTENDQNDKQPANDTNNTTISKVEETLQCKNVYENRNIHEKARSGNQNEMIADAKDTVNGGDLRGNDIQQTAAESVVSSDSGLDLDNIHDKQTSLDFESVSEKCSVVELDEKGREPELGLSFVNYGLNNSGEMRSVFGTSDKEKTSGMEASKRRKWKFMHPFKSIMDGDFSIGQSLQRVLGTYNNLQHMVYSLLTGRPVVVMGTRRQEVAVKELVQALSVFVPYTPRSCSVSLLCQIKQLKMSDIHAFQLRGMIRPDKRSLDYLIPKSVRRYVTLVDMEKSTVYCLPYQGILLNFIGSIHNKKKSFKSDAALLSFIQLCLQEISTKAFNFYHTITSSSEQTDFSGATLPHKSSMLELSMERYLNRAGVLNSDCRIIRHLTEIVKLQQIEEEFRSKYLTDAPSYPFSVAYQSLQTYRL